VPSSARLRLLNAQSETRYREWIETYATSRGWLIYHTYNSRRSQKGFPDLFMVRGGRAVALEVKGARGQTTPEQDQWIWAMKLAGIEAYVVWPKDEDFVRDLLQ
jgi:VRR-NUC domain-containing protein